MKRAAWRCSAISRTSPRRADAKYDKFDIAKVLERLQLKGSIVVKKAYCDWGRYKAFKAVMHETAFELIDPACGSRGRIRPTSAWWSMR